ncbi:hypothetical protein AXE80_09190 [Wenyingzhuangia fucanilytica]|uniref:Tetracyclin repressor-like C-terminal domain-containing protein n=1 Tax=Wenyingzhuangia fucanilytica TaxID=1790137 RepID=A0A1B1Y6N7_9FLAO|nr:TetR family transcriptional regulator C-terminal domain-containing protein [Wenyingzhuangia fucanilytica]ANW96442.1 hypothetical protein AXE80_09190 [Wenyingzhuangia fucanilytica]
MKAKINKTHILTHYINYALNDEFTSKSIHSFAKKFKISEKEFYKHYTSFDQISSDVYVSFYDETIKLIMSEIDYNKLDAKNELLAFYYTFFELLSQNRSFVIQSLGTPLSNLKKAKTLTPLKSKFKDFIKSLQIETLDVKQEKNIEELAWTQFLFTLKFWLEDDSPSFEKTDLFIEKTVNTSFDLLGITTVENIMDIGKFFFKEKIKPQF